MTDTILSDLTSYGEAVAAISFSFAERKEDYDFVAKNYGNEIGGFVGIWSECATAAKIFEEEAAPYTAGEDFYWIEAIEEFAAQFISAFVDGGVPAEDDLHRWAAGAIEKCRL